MSRFDIGDIVSSRVMRSAASPLHGVLREESTRHDAAVLHSRATPSSPSHCETGPHHYLCFPQHNTLDAAVDRRQTVALLGGGAFLAKFFAEQCLRRGIGVTALARDPTGAAAALAPALRAGAPNGPQAQAQPNGPQAQAQPNRPQAQAPPNGPQAQAQPNRPQAQAPPNGPQAQAQPNRPQAQAPPNGPQAQAPPNGPQAQAPPNGPQAQAPPNGPQAQAQSNRPQAQAPPNGPQAQAQPNRPQAQAPPNGPQAQAQPNGPQAQAQPNRPQAQAQPNGPQAQAPPNGPQAQAPPNGPQAQAPPNGPQAQAPPNGPQAQAPPNGPQAQAQPNGPQAQAPPNGPQAQAPPNGPQAQAPPNGPQAQAPPNGPQALVDIVAGDVACAESVRRAVRGASLVVFLASAHRSAWPPWRAGALRRVDVGGLRNAIDACRLVDAHLLVLVPRRAMGSSLLSSLWPPLWPSLWARAGERQEQCLLDDAGAAVAGDVRFTILRVDGVVYPCHNERAVVAKNNRVDDAVAAVHIPHGDVDARMLATIALRAVALSRASVGSRIDVAGQRRHGADLRQIDALLHGLRSE